MIVYPYNTPIIMDDDIFVSYGGQTGTSSLFQREAAYLIAEQQMTSYLGTYLLPTDITGSVPYDYRMKFVPTDFGYVQRIYGARVVDAFGNTRFDISGSSSRMVINEDTFGYLYLYDTECRCGYPEYAPYYLQFMYQAGLPTGTANQPAMLLALTMAAQISLNEIGFPSMNEGVGDVGIEEFYHLQYKETRKKWKNTAFGASARAAKVAQLVDSTIRKARRALMIGRI